LNDIPVPGDKMEFEDFTLRFLVDEDLDELHGNSKLDERSWISRNSYKQIYDWQSSNELLVLTI
jgi:hypothetical protein